MPWHSADLRIWLKRLLAAALGLAGTYLLLANLFLNTPLGAWAVNRRPERLTVTWESAWSLWPGEVRMRGLAVRGKTRRVSWSFEAERGRGWIDLPGLLSRRFEVRGFEGEGVRSSTSREPGKAAPARPPARRRRRPWTVRFTDVSLGRVREIGIDGFRFQGDGRAAGGFSITMGGPFRLETTSLTLKRARLSRGGTPLASGLDLAAEAAIGPYVVREHPGLAALDFVTGTLTARGSVPVPALPGTAGNQGSLAVDLRMHQGRLATGTRARLRAPQGEAGFSVSVGVLTLGAAFRDLSAGRSEGRPPLLQASSLRLATSTRELRPSLLLATARRTNRSLVSNASFEELRLAGTAGRTSWQVAADRGSGRISLAELLRRRVVLAGLNAEGITAGAVRGPTRPPGEPRRRRPWSVEVEGARLSEVRDLSLDDLRLEGNALLTGSFALGPEGRFGLKDATASLAAGRLTRNGEELARNLAVRIEAGAAPFLPRENPGAAALRFVSGALRAAGRIAQGPGRMGTLDADLRLDRGRLTPGTRAAIRLRPPAAVSSANPLTIKLAVEPGETGPRLMAAAEGRDLAVGILRCGVFRLATDSPEVDLAKLLASAREIQASGEIPALAADVRVEGLRVDAPAGRLFWRARLDRGNGRLDLPALRRREIILDGVRGEGFSLRMDPVRGVAAARREAAQPWSLRLGDARLTRVRELALGDQRLAGSGRLEGSLTFSSRGELDLRRLVFDIPAGRLVVDGKTVARDLAVHTAVRLAPLVLAGARRADVLRRLTLAGDVRGRVSSLAFLHRYFKKDPWLGIQGRGRLDAKARLAGGRLLPGTRLRIDRAVVEAEYLESRATGEAVVTGSVEKKGAVLQVLFDRFQSALRDRRDAPAHLRGRGLRLAVSSSDVDLAAPVSDLRATIDLPEADVVNLVAYNAYLPAGTGVAILGGTGRLRSRLDLDVAARKARGEVSLTSSAVRVQFQDVEIEGNLSLRALLSGSDFQTSGFRLDGTRLELNQVALRETGEPDGTEAATGWWAHLDLPDGQMVWKRPFALRSTARLAMRDSGLLLSLFARKRNYLAWFKDLLNVRDLTALADIRLREGVIEIDPLHVTGGRLDLRSRLRFTRESKRGDLLLRWGRLTTGIELRDGKRNFKLVRPVEWYEAGGGLE